MARQQRTPGRRRGLGILSQNVYPPLSWRVESVVGANVFLEVLSPDGLTPLTLGGWTRQDFCGATFRGPFTFPLGWGVDSDRLVMLFADTIIAGDFLVMPPAPGLARGPFGEFLAASQIELITTPPAPTDQDIISGISGGSAATLVLDSSGLNTGICDTACINHIATGQRPTSVQIIDDQITLTFVINPSSGDQIDITGGLTNWINNTGGTVNSASIVLS